MGTLPLHESTRETRQQLAALARRYHGSGWMLGTSGNLSARVEDRVVVTASGRHKGDLTEDDFVEVNLDGALIGAGPDARPSAETSIHLAVYRTRHAVRSVLHVHTVASTLAGMRGMAADGHALDFTGFEMVKGWGLWHEGAEAKLACFVNHAHVPDIARDIEGHLTTTRAQDEVPALLIAGHGLTAWGDAVDTAHRHVEVTEFLSRIEMAR